MSELLTLLQYYIITFLTVPQKIKHALERKQIQQRKSKSLLYDKGKVQCYRSHDTTYDSWPKTTETWRNFPCHYSLMKFRVFHIPWGKSELTLMFLLWIPFAYYKRLRIWHKHHLSKHCSSLVMWMPTAASQTPLRSTVLINSKDRFFERKSTAKYRSSEFQYSHVFTAISWLLSVFQCPAAMRVAL